MPRVPDGPHLDNGKGGAKKAKVEIRRRVAEAIGAPVHVFEAFAGAGSLYRQTWRTLAASYVGCDRRYFRDGRKVFVADNRRVLRAIDLRPFNLFDLDAYGSPWDQAVIIAARRKLAVGERVGIVITEGNGLNYKNGVVPIAVTDLTGLVHRKTPGAALSQSRAQIHRMMWEELARRMDAVVERQWRAEVQSGASAWYVGVVLSGVARAQENAAKERPKEAELAQAASLLVAPVLEAPELNAEAFR